MRHLLLWILLIPTLSFAHEIQSITQLVGIKKQDETGLQQDLIGRFTLNRKFDVGAQGTYLERFDFYEKRAGGFLVYRPSERLNLEARYLLGNGNEILPEKQGLLSAHYALTDGFSAYLNYRDTQYSVTHLYSGTFGMEIEKFPNLILIPQAVFGKATFDSPAGTKDVYNYGLKAIYYIENSYSFTIFGYSGKEASQGIVGESNFLVKTLTGGIGAGLYLTQDLKADLIIDHTNYHELNNQFLTTTLNLVWKL